MVIPLLKVCGLREASQAAAVAALGVDAVGVIAVAASPRWLEPSQRPGLFGAVLQAAPDCARVLVVADPAEEDLPSLDPARGGHNVVQFHGRETPEQLRQLRQRLAPELRFWKALRIRTPADLDQAQIYGEDVDALLIDAWVPGVLGGTGHRVPIEWLEHFQPALPWWLAGGVTPERVAPLLERLKPSGLDASSGVEIAPGLKDLARVEALVAAVAAARRGSVAEQ